MSAKGLSGLKLLTLNTKLAKSLEKYSVITAGLAFAPHMHSGYNVCRGAGW